MEDIWRDSEKEIGQENDMHCPSIVYKVVELKTLDEKNEFGYCI